MTLRPQRLPRPLRDRLWAAWAILLSSLIGLGIGVALMVIAWLVAGW